MSKLFERIEEAHRDFIARQAIFFTASATADSRVNVSPRETACFRVLDDLTVCYLDCTGSGNETAAHLRADGRLTVMFCAFAGPPLILRLYGRGTSLWRGSPHYQDLLDSRYDRAEPPGARQIVRLAVDRVQTSCGYGVPLFDHKGDRQNLRRFAEAKGEDGMRAYRQEKNRLSIDGLQTGLSDELR